MCVCIFRANVAFLLLWTFLFRTIANLDYEIFSEFLFQVYVRDSGQPPRSADSPADVVIKVSAAASDALWIIYGSDGFYVPALC